nr:hypothetical protein HmN_000985600 [Hymenolepis microstoma]
MASCLLIEYPMSIEKAPFMATVGNCGGAIVSRNFILISGKCLCLGERPLYAYTGTSWGNIGNLPRENYCWFERTSLPLPFCLCNCLFVISMPPFDSHSSPSFLASSNACLNLINIFL